MAYVTANFTIREIAVMLLAIFFVIRPNRLVLFA